MYLCKFKLLEVKNERLRVKFRPCQFKISCPKPKPRANFSNLNSPLPNPICKPTNIKHRNMNDFGQRSMSFLNRTPASERCSRNENSLSAQTRCNSRSLVAMSVVSNLQGSAWPEVNTAHRRPDHQQTETFQEFKLCVYE